MSKKITFVLIMAVILIPSMIKDMENQLNAPNQFESKPEIEFKQKIEYTNGIPKTIHYMIERKKW